MVTIRLPAVLLPSAGEAAEVEVTASTLGEAFESLFAAHPVLRAQLVDRAGEISPHLLVFHGDRLLPRRAWAAVPLASGDSLRLVPSVAGGADDVRMRGFRRRASVAEALAAALEGARPLPDERVPLAECAGRVAAGPVISGVDIPSFARSTMDGYALRAADTFGSLPYDPVVLTIGGESMPGRPAPGPLAPGTACRIMTGAALPAGADAVLRAEEASEVAGRLEVRAAVAAGRNVGRVGEDVRRGDQVVSAGRRLLPQDVGLLSSVGCSRVAVYRRPRVRLIVSGNELLPAGRRPTKNRITDSNGPMLAALVERDGGVVEASLRLPDDPAALRRALGRPGAEVIVTAGAASVGREDWVPVLVAELGHLTVHGVAMRPSSPTGVGRIGDTPVVLLPGNPVSCLVAYDFFAGPVIRTLGGLAAALPYRVASLPLAARLVSQIGRTDYARVRVRSGRVEPVAIGGASALSSVTRADGFVVIPEASEGYPEGTEVEVHLYQPPEGDG
ncbi:MAG: molybdopterin molybdenumtransferase MoeA [Actinobacteria bacterium]|nr:molybdopterin molybdenumtransferase MoeA [Actinomycetota bacterium]